MCIRQGAQLPELLKTYQRQTLAVLAALFLLGAGGAVAVATAVAGLEADQASQPITQVREAVNTLPLEPQVLALDAHRLNLFRSDVTRSSDTAETLLRRLGVFDPAAAAFLRADPLTQKHLLGRLA